jgi:hypothetical protein
MHLVLDTTQTDRDDRSELYLDGVLIEKSTTTGPPQNVTIDLQTGRHFVLGNREVGDQSDRSFEGELYYAALYDVPLDEQTIDQHVGVLLASDDGS